MNWFGEDECDDEDSFAAHLTRRYNEDRGMFDFVKRSKNQPLNMNTKPAPKKAAKAIKAVKVPTVKFAYTTAENKSKIRTVSNPEIVTKSTGFLLSGFDHDRKAIRTFKLKNVKFL